MFLDCGIGRHIGEPIPFGLYKENTGFVTIELDVSKFTPALLLSGTQGEILK